MIEFMQRKKNETKNALKILFATCPKTNFEGGSSYLKCFSRFSSKLVNNPLNIEYIYMEQKTLKAVLSRYLDFKI